jgi:hypothetical protein
MHKFKVLYILTKEKKMGNNCAGNPVEFIMNEYGADVAKLVSSVKAKELIDQKLPAIKDQLTQKAQ